MTSQNGSPRRNLRLTPEGRTPGSQLNPISERVEYDSLQDRLTIIREEDFTAHLNEIREQKNALPNGMERGANWRRIGSIPMTLAQKWLTEDGFDCMDPNNAKEVKRRLNEHNKLRTVDKML